MSSFKRDTEVEIYCYVGKAWDLYLFTNDEKKGFFYHLVVKMTRGLQDRLIHCVHK